MALLRTLLLSTMAAMVRAQPADLPAEPPETVVQRAVEAQARGDVDAFIAECAIDAYSEMAAN